MKTSAFAVLFAAAAAAEPLTENAAKSELATLRQLRVFAEGHADLRYTKYITGCKAASETFLSQCASKTDADCKTKVCSTMASESDCTSPYVYSSRRRICQDKSLTTETACKAASGRSWEEAPVRSVCCDADEMEKKCKFDANGTEYRWGCCDHCVANPPAAVKHMAAICSREKVLGISLLGTTQGTCHNCVAGQTVKTGVESQSDCSNNGGTWTANKTATAMSGDDGCEDGACFKCSGCGSSCPADPTNCQTAGSCSGHTSTDNASCASNGGTWTAATWGQLDSATESDCEGKGSWHRKGKWEEGTLLQDTTLNTHLGPFTHGPHHKEPEHILPKTCISQNKFLADAASGKTAQAAFDADPKYYQDEIYKAVLFRAVLSNNASATMRARMEFSEFKYPMCFIGMWEPKNRGEVVIKSSNRSYFLILNPENMAGGEPLVISGTGTGVVLGGTSAGTIHLKSAGKIRVCGVTNSGPIMATTSQDIVIVDTVNREGGTITATDVTATLFSITNAGTVTASGKIAAFGIKNSGNITINSGSIELHLICPTTGSVEIKAGVTGKLSYQKGCKGTITNTAGITEEEKAEPAVQPAPGGGGFKPENLAEKAAEETLIATTIIAGLDFGKLEKDAALKTKIVDALKSNFATANDVPASQVAIILSKGSVKVEARITAKAGMNVTSNVPSAAELTNAVKAMPGIDAVKEAGAEISAGEPDTYKIAKGATAPTKVEPLAAKQKESTTKQPTTNKQQTTNQQPTNTTTTATKRDSATSGAFAACGLLSVAIALLGASF